MSTLKVNAIRNVLATSDAVTLATDGTCTANITNKPNRNLIINGAMQVAQRGTSSTTSGYGTVDRFQVNFSGTDEAPTQAQVDVAAGTTPYSLGFRKALKITNGNQTSGAGSSDYVYYQHKIEAQDISQSGWNYISSSSYITLSFWIKSSVAQSFKGHLKTQDGTSQLYPFDTGSLSADTWTKVTKTIAGNSNLQFDTNNEAGLHIAIMAFIGTDLTASSATENTWQAYAGGIFGGKDNTSTWYTTNDATLEITGVQLEVGSVATDFEHRSFADELKRCQRYLYTAYQGSSYSYITGPNDQAIGAGWAYSSSEVDLVLHFPVQLRDTPTVAQANAGYSVVVKRPSADRYIDAGGWNGQLNAGRHSTRMYATTGSSRLSGSLTEGTTYFIFMNSGSVYLRFDAEL